MPTAENMAPTMTTTGGTSSMPSHVPTGQKAMRMHSDVATDSSSWRASSAPAWRHIRP